MYLDDIKPREYSVDYGTLGTHGSLGYDTVPLVVQGRYYNHALSAHGPSRLTFDLKKKYRRFECCVALNDDVIAAAAPARFLILVDGIAAAVASQVTAGGVPHKLSVDVSNASSLELIVDTPVRNYCHALWLEPELDERVKWPPQKHIYDCLGRAAIQMPFEPIRTEHCIATVVTPGYAELLDTMLTSLTANGGCQNATVVVFIVGDDSKCTEITTKHGAIPIYCSPIAPVNNTLKSVMYSIAHVVEANSYLCLDADMLILEDLRPLFTTLTICAATSILVCKHGSRSAQNLGNFFALNFGTALKDADFLIGITSGEENYSLVINDGLFAGSREAMLGLDHTMRQMMPQSAIWVGAHRNRNEFVFNLALAHMQCGVELDESYNVQTFAHTIKADTATGSLRALWNGRQARVIHFSGAGRHLYPEWRDLFMDDVKRSRFIES